MPKAKKKCWSQSVGLYGSRVRVAELAPGGPLYLLWVDRDRGQQKRALGHRDRKRGKDEALALASNLASGRDRAEPARLTVDTLIDNYMRNGLHGRTEKHRKEVERKLSLWRDFLGASRSVHSLGPADVDRYLENRRSRSQRASDTEVRRVSQTTLWHDVVALMTAINFATRHRDDRGKPLLLANPLHGVRVSKTVSPARPVATHSLYAALRGVSESVNPKFRRALDLAYATGHRIDAILKLRWDDVDFSTSPNAPLGSIRWRSEFDKIDNEHVIPMNGVARSTLAEARERRRGSEWVFPSDKNDEVPVDRHLASRWLRRAETLAGEEHERGRGWHAFRRGWASARKHLPDVDVAAAGGWKDTATMKRCYQHADAVGVLRVVTVGDSDRENKTGLHPKVQAGGHAFADRLCQSD